MSFAVLNTPANLIQYSNKEPNNHLHAVYIALSVFLTGFGWISDSLLGRYRAITVGILMLLTVPTGKRFATFGVFWYLVTLTCLCC